MPEEELLGECLKRLREAHKLPRWKVAEAVRHYAGTSTSENKIGLWENGEGVSGPALAGLCALFGPDEIIPAMLTPEGRVAYGLNRATDH